MKNFILVMLVLALAVTLVAACGGGDAAPEPTTAPAEPTEPPVPVGDAAEGEKLYGGTCIACHGAGGIGVEGLGKDMTSSEFIAGQSDAELLEFIKTGRPTGDPLNTTGIDMPPKGGNPAITDEQIMHLVAYMRVLQK